MGGSGDSVVKGEGENLFFFNIVFIHLRERQRDREDVQWEGQRRGRGKADSPLSWEPNVGLDPRIPGSRPELKVDT